MPNGTPSCSRGLAADELAHARDLERRALDDARRARRGRRLGTASTARSDDAGAGDADVDDAVGLADAVERAGHERVVLDRVAEDDELRAADAVAVGGARAPSRTMTSPMRATASMLMPARVVATLTDAQTRSVRASASRDRGDQRRGRRGVMPLCTSAEKPPMKSTPTSCAARSSVSANGDVVVGVARLRRPARSASPRCAC